MAVDPDRIKRIMGMPDSVTGKLVALRETPGDDPLKTGVWYSDFTRVKTESEQRGIPFVAMWTNGDLCGFCRRFTSNILDTSFLEWMKTSDCLFWLGGSMDDGQEDKYGGTGFTWCMGPDKSVSYFPFFAVSKAGVNTFYGSGHDFDKRRPSPEGAPLAIKTIESILSGKGPSDVTPQAIEDGTNRRLSIRFNTAWDRDHILRFQNALKENGGHCPCQARKSPDTMCMCRSFLDSQEAGMCRCGAFEKYVV